MTSSNTAMIAIDFQALAREGGDEKVGDKLLAPSSRDCG